MTCEKVYGAAKLPMMLDSVRPRCGKLGTTSRAQANSRPGQG